MNPQISARLESFRHIMKEHGIAAAIIPQADPHQSEYLAPHWQVRRWLSGFTGSAGDLVLTADSAALWTDSRYFIQAAEQLEDTEIELMKDGLADTPSIADYLCKKLNTGDTVGLDGMLFTNDSVAQLQSKLAQKNIVVVTNFDVIDNIWSDRPALPENKIYIHELQYAGVSAKDKIAAIKDDIKKKGADATFISMLDEIAWTLNIRCNDVKHTPVATSFLYISDTENILFIDPAKTNNDSTAYLASQGVDTKPYNCVKSFLESLDKGLTVLVDANHTAMELLNILGSRAIDGGTSAAARLKSVKNEIQLNGIRKAMVRDGVAMVRSLMEIEKRLANGIETTELDVANILVCNRRKGEHYFEESFGTIAGYGAHGAIVHYEATEETASTLQRKGLLLIDSGAQYLDGTTDITRTIALSAPTAQEKRDFTLVMKGHIAIATAVFPEGTRGAQLDVLARQFLWKDGLSYLHGTGHGVGHFLGVHEGPHSIRLNYVDAPMLPGSITSNEPGVYRENVHGIRCENLVLCKEEFTTEFGTFLAFETLTLCPFDLSLFDLTIMTPEEIEWINTYHSTVRERLLPALASDEERAWLELHTKQLPIK